MESRASCVTCSRQHGRTTKNTAGLSIRRFGVHWRRKRPSPKSSQEKHAKVSMSMKVTKGVFRRRELTPAEIARDRKLRELIPAEFPPLRRSPIPRPLSASLKKAMKRSSKTSYQIAKEAGVSQIMVSRFLSGKRDIRLATA